ncbi:MAG: twin-arginine translocase subunit TatB [Pseudomonadota bacterium]
MFDIGWDEMLFTVVVAIIVIGPKDLPRALRTAGRWIGKIRRVSGHFRTGIETMIREAELEEMEKQWREQNAAIMAAHPSPDAAPHPASAEAALAAPDPGTAPGTDPAAAQAAGPTVAGPTAAEPKAS